MNGDGKIDQLDANIVQAAMGQTATQPFDARDVNGNGVIDSEDVQFLESQCTFPNCAQVAPPGMIFTPPPATFQGFLHAAPQITVGNTVQLDWPAQPGAARYHIYRYTTTPPLQLLLGGAPTVTINLSTQLTINVPQDILAGVLNPACPLNEDQLWFCQLSDIVQTASAPAAPPSQLTYVGFPAALQEIGQTTATTYSEAMPTTIQSIYFVRAEDSSGNLGAASNIVGAPSFAQN